MPKNGDLIYKQGKEVKSMTKPLQKESDGKTKEAFENLTRLLIERGFKPPREAPRGVRIRVHENPKVPLKPQTSKKDSTNDENSIK